MTNFSPGEKFILLYKADSVSNFSVQVGYKFFSVSDNCYISTSKDKTLLNFTSASSMDFTPTTS
jgi:hypothetical protein